MALTVHQFPCLGDNYGYLVRDEASGLTATIYTSDAEAILSEMKRLGWDRLDFILNTHWHPDHAGGNARLKADMGCEIVGPEEVTRIAPLDRVLADGETVRLGETVFEVIATPGHTLGHIVYVDRADNLAFVGDTLFALGCGRLFEGTAEQMWGSLTRLAALPDDMAVYCAHEYTAANARFALSLSEAPELAARAEQVFRARDKGEPTVPTTIGAEKATNPFLTARDAAQFAERRAAKDSFAG